MSSDKNFSKTNKLTTDPKQLLQSRACDALATAESGSGSPAGALKGAQPSNTAPYNYNYPNYLRIVHQGIDSLYLSYQGTLSVDWSTELAIAKDLARDSDPRIQATAQVKIGGHCFEVMGSGRGKYAYVLKDNWFQIQIAGTDSQALPIAYVQISSELLTHHPLVDVLESINHIINTIASKIDSVSVSRLDLCVDFLTKTNFSEVTDMQWVTRAKMFSRHSEGEQFTGWSIGRGGMMARLYDKTKECTKSNKNYFYPIWEANGWELNDQVWRLEFQFRREVLNEFNCIAIDELEENLSSLWFYATTQWLRLAIPSVTDTVRTRWEIHPVWSLLSVLSWKTLPKRDLRRVVKERIPSDDYLFTTGFGVITSYMAREGIDSLSDAVAAYINDAKLYHDSKGRQLNRYFHHYIIEKKALKSRKYNTLRNQTEEQKTEKIKTNKKKSKDYKAASDGE